MSESHRNPKWPTLRIEPPDDDIPRISSEFASPLPTESEHDNHSHGRGRIRRDRSLLDPLDIPSSANVGTSSQYSWPDEAASGSRSRSTSRSRSQNSSKSPVSPASKKFLDLIEPLSRNRTPRRSGDFSDSDRQDISFFSTLTEDDNMSVLKDEIRSALGDKKTTGTWLRKPPPLSPGKNSSKVSFKDSDDVIEMVSLDFDAKKELDETFDNLSGFNIRQSAAQKTPKTPADGVFRNLTTKIINNEGTSFGYDAPRTPKIPKTPRERPLSGQFEDTYRRDRLPEGDASLNLRLHGKSLMIFQPYNRLRVYCAETLQRKSYGVVMRILLLLQAALLSYQQWNPTRKYGVVVYGVNWADWVLVAINVFYTVESAAQIVAWGLWDDSQMYDELNLPYVPLKEIFGITRLRDYLFGSKKSAVSHLDKEFKRSITFRANLSKEVQSVHRAYLRKTWNRIDFVATVSFWINLFMSVAAVSNEDARPLFRVLECLRIIRLTNITTKISLILQTIKNGGPQLIDVILFILYFLTFFAIIGVQSFKSSLRRFCVWTNPSDATDYYTSSQHCGGSYYMENGTLHRQPYYLDSVALGDRSKGYLCPVNSTCRTLDNPYGNTYSFDNIINSLQLVFVIMSGNTFTNIMYETMDTDSMASSIFFIFGIFLLYLWMINLLIAVISTSFRATREASDKGFGDNKLEDFDLNWHFPDTIYSRIYLSSKFLFDILIFAGIVFQCKRNKHSTKDEIFVDYTVQSVISVILLVEIVIRFLIYLPNCKKFFDLKRNLVDLFLVVVTCIISIPIVHEKMGRVYDWFRIFFLLRFYRDILNVRFVRRLWAKVSNNISTIFNLTLFYFLFLYLASILCSRYFEGFASDDDIENLQFPFQNLPNSFLGLFVITSTENWSGYMYEMQEIAPNKSAALFGACLFVLWFLLSNSVVLNIFIAIIGDSLDVSEREKRKAQVKKFVLVDFPKRLNSIAEESVLSNLRSRFFGPTEDELEGHGDQEIQRLLLNGAAIQVFLEDELNELQDSNEDTAEVSDGLRQLPKSPVARFFKLHYTRFMNHPWTTNVINFIFAANVSKNPFYNSRRAVFTRHNNYLSLAEKFELETKKHADERKKFIEANPDFNNALYVLRPKQPLRRLCQKITKSSSGERYEGTDPNKIALLIFNTLIAFSTIAIVVIACYTTPIYKKQFTNNDTDWNWTFDLEVAFGVFFLVEFLIKIIADGLFFTPNGYFRNSWNAIDFVVLLSIWINIIAVLKGNNNLSRIMRGLKALRALRILTISNTSRDIFHKVMIAGVWKIFSAAFLSFTLIFPYAVWGLNLFTGRLDSCNDGESYYSGCINEYSGTVENWDILMPRAYITPQLEFNRFASALLTLFEVISLEGWTDLLQNLVNTTGVGSPPGNYSSPENAIFIVAFILIGIIFILTLFVSVIITNYSELSGSAFLTLQQTSWNEVTKLLRQARPRSRPDKSNLGSIRKFCFNQTVEKKKFIDVFLFVVLWVHISAILLEMHPSTNALDNFRYIVYICSSSIFLCYILARMIAIGPKKFFKAKWNTYEFIVFLGAWSTSLASFFISRSTVFANINKLFLVGIFTVLIHMSNRLSHLLKIASASLPSLLSLIFAWGILFLVYAIALNQIFGLTRLGANTTGNQNLRTVTKALILLFQCSFGEGWNYTMRDFAVESPYCVESDNLNSDCGDMQYAYILFISWNIISMYIFVNMFVSMIFESFSYVYTDSKGTSSLDRDEIRHFKSVWLEFDPKGTGYISLEKLPALLRKMDGYFSFKIYDGKWLVSEIQREFIKKSADDPYKVDVDFRGLNRLLNHLDVGKVNEHRALYDRFIEEVKYNIEVYKEPGVSFSRIILQIPLYSRFDERNCLTLTEFLDRLVVTRKLKERLSSRRGLETLSMIIPRMRFLKQTAPHRIANYFNDFERRRSLNPFNTPTFTRSEADMEGTYVFAEDGYWSPKNSPEKTKSRPKSRAESEQVLSELDRLAEDIHGSPWEVGFHSVKSDIDTILEDAESDDLRVDDDSDSTNNDQASSKASFGNGRRIA